MFKRGSARKEIIICLGQWSYMSSIFYLLIVFDWHLVIFFILLFPAIVISIRSYVLIFRKNGMFENQKTLQMELE